MAAVWKLDSAHTNVNFTVKHLMIAKLNGTFDRVSGQIQYDTKSPETSEIDVHIEAASIHTRDAKRDEHLRSLDFFNTATFPDIHFHSTHIEKKAEDNYKVTGDLRIRDVTREVILDALFTGQEIKDPFGAVKIVASAVTHVSRESFGLQWNAAIEAGGFLLGDEVVINIDVQFIKPTA
jgi:polyisoprenoid-binding protein YceI